jgi:HEAT repeat protein
VESLTFLEALLRALGRGWSARYGMIAPYGVFGVILTSDVGGSVEVVPSLVRGNIVTWSPFPFARGTPHYDLYTFEDGLTRTPVLADAVAWLERWRKARGSLGSVAARMARIGAKRARSARTTPASGARRAAAPGAASSSSRPGARAPVGAASGAAAIESLTDALRDKRLGQIERARKLAKQCDRDQAARALLAIAKRASGDARANALDVLAVVGRPEDGPELARYLDDPERNVQRVAIDGIKRIGYTAAVPVLATLVLGRDAKPNSGRSRIAVEAATAMKALSGKRGAAALTGYLTSDDPRVREAACVAFTLFANPGTKQARPLLERLLTDDDARVARAAKRALAVR